MAEYTKGNCKECLYLTSCKHLLRIAIPTFTDEEIDKAMSRFDDCARFTPCTGVVEVRQGAWKKVCRPERGTFYKCSLCDTIHDRDYDYCNNCYAKMDGGVMANE